MGNLLGEAVERLRRNDPGLTQLCLKDNRIGDKGAKALAEALRHNGALTTLFLGGNYIGDEGAKALAEALRRNGAVKKLQLERDGIGDEGAKALAEALRHNREGSASAAAPSADAECQEAAPIPPPAAATSQPPPPPHTAPPAAAASQPSPPPPMAAASQPAAPTGSPAACTSSGGDGSVPQASNSPETSQPPEPPQAVPSRVEEIPFSELQLGTPIGTGSSKTVHRARWRGQDVAALTLRSGDAEAELGVFERLGRRSGLTRLLCASRDPEGHRVLVTEFAPMGSLHKVLSDLEEDGRSAGDLVLMKCAMQVCDGMLQLVEESLIHRDLALRNVLVFGFDPENARAVEVKITDYGLTREGLCYYSGSEGVPIRWMPPEGLKRRRWSEKSDVWAFGVLMWELWSAAEVPYAFVGSDEEVARLVYSGRRLEKPRGCPDGIFALMERCWEEKAARRLSFKELKDELLDLHAELRNLYDLAGDTVPSTSQQGDHQDRECVLCYDAAAWMALLPCGHMCACEECAPRLQQCPMCREQVRDTARIYQI